MQDQQEKCSIRMFPVVLVSFPGPPGFGAGGTAAAASPQEFSVPLLGCRKRRCSSVNENPVSVDCRVTNVGKGL